MAEMIDAQKLITMKEQHPGVPVVCYVNTTAEVKAQSDYCCTSANVVNIVNAVDSNKIIFVPDKNLGMYAAAQSDKEFIYYDGYCHVHLNILKQHTL